MKYYVTADPHGFYDELKNSLAESGFFEEKERKKLIVCGDLFDRGRQAKELQEFLVRLLERDEVVLIRGNHEDLATELLHNAWKYFASESSAIQSHHYLNGTVDTLLALTDRTLSEAVSDARSFYFAATETPFFSRLIPAMCDYFETERHIFVHGWIPCRTEGSLTAPAAYRFLPDWRKAEKDEWTFARWYNGMNAWKHGAREAGKTIVCGHWHASYGHAVLQGRGSEFGEGADFSPFAEEGILALDACTSYSKRVNCVVIEDEPIVREE